MNVYETNDSSAYRYTELLVKNGEISETVGLSTQTDYKEDANVRYLADQ